MKARVHVAAAIALAVGAMSFARPASQGDVPSRSDLRKSSPHRTSECGPLAQQVLTRASNPSGSADKGEQETLVAMVRVAESIPDGTGVGRCTDEIVGEIARGSICGSAGDLIVTTIATDGVLSEDVVARSLDEHRPCARTVVVGAGVIRDAGPAVIRAVQSWVAHENDRTIRSAGLVVLGTLARRARDLGDRKLSDEVEHAIKRALLKATGLAERVQLIEAAGNAGCNACLPELTAALRGSSELRRAAVGALRFISRGAPALQMCRVLEGERDANVREHSAWALGWSAEAGSARAECLFRSAALDPSARVRISAAMSLVALRKDVPDAAGALLELTQPTYRDETVRALATRASVGGPISHTSDSELSVQ